MVREYLFIILILIATLSGLAAPSLFLWLKPYIPFLLGMVMFCIGLNIPTSQLRTSFFQPKILLLSFGKFMLMPALAFTLGKLFALPEEGIIGMVILGACPGGVSANIMSHLSGANTALTVTLTIVTTLLSPLLTPIIIYIFLHHYISLDMWAMSQKLFWVVIFPISDALLVRRFFTKFARNTHSLFSGFSFIAVAAVIAFVAAANQSLLFTQPWKLLMVVLLFNISGYIIGYMVGVLCLYERQSCQSIAFEYGMQDSSLGIMIATQFFKASIALPSALCSLVQNLTGPGLSRYFSRYRP